jgi:hypothetical protein
MAEPDVDFPQYVYVPWVDGEPHSARASEAREIASALASKKRIPLVGVGATKNQLPDDWGSLPYRTLKSRHGSSHGSAVEIHFWPMLDTLAAMPPHGTHAFVLEWGSDDLSGWARHNHAVHFDTKQTLEPSLSSDALELYGRIDWNGNNGWHDAPGKRDALHDLRKLREMGELDPADLGGYMIGRHSNRAIRQLIELAKRA